MSKFKDIVYGPETEFGLREIIFHQVCFLSSIALAIGLLLSINIQQWDLAATVLIIQFFVVTSYWLSRVMNRFLIGWLLFTIASYVLIAANYFLNAGINGTTGILSLLILAILFATSRHKIHWIFTTLHALLLSALSLYELNYGSGHIVAYPNSHERFIDTIFNYLLVFTVLYLVFGLIRHAYETQKAKVEEQRRTLEQQQSSLEKSNRELIKVLSIIAHDVRNPLASIQSYLELNADGNLLSEAEQKKINQDLLKMVQNTSHMLDDMVNWSKIQISGTRTNFQEVGIGYWLNKTVDHLREMAKAKGVMFLADYRGSDKLYCDPILMTVIIRNLIQNAVKFTPSGRTVELKVQEQEKAMIFKIKDEGIGIDPANQNQLFSGNASIQQGTENEKGSGFGLFIVKEYIDAHQGQIEIDSKVGQGSLFTVSIPKSPQS